MGAASLSPTVLPPHSLAAAHAALGTWLRASHPASGRAGMRRAGGAARPSRIAPTPRWWPPVRLRMSRRLPDKCRGAGSGLVRSTPRAAASELLPCLLLCHADAPAPLGSRQRALCCRPPSERLAGHLTFVTAFGLRRDPYAQPGLCVSRAPPTHPRLSRGRACSSRIARTCIARLPPSAVRPAAAQLL
jgi:hypothetical protein